MTAKALLKSKWYQLVIVNKLMGLCSKKYNTLVTVDLHYLMMIIITTLSQLTHFSFYIHSSPFAVSVHTLQSLICTTSAPCPIPSCLWLNDNCPTPVHDF